MTSTPEPSVTALATSPIVISEQQLHFFTFYGVEGITQGMRYHNELYELIGEFKPQQQLEAYNRACMLMITRGKDVIVSVSKQSYKVWSKLRSR